MGYNIENIFGRADEQSLAELAGVGAIRLLAVLDTSLTAPSNLRNLVKGYRNYSSYLRDQKTRNLLFDLLPQNIADDLAESLGCTSNQSSYEALKKLNIGTKSGLEKKLFQFLFSYH